MNTSIVHGDPPYINTFPNSWAVPALGEQGFRPMHHHILACPNQDTSLRFRRSARTSVLAFILPTHLDPISRPLSTFPEPSSPPLPHKHTMAEATVLWPIVPFPAAAAAYHAVSPFVGMFLTIIVASVARIDLLAAAEAKPTVALRIMSTATATRQFRTGGETQRLFLSAWAGSGR